MPLQKLAESLRSGYFTTPKSLQWIYCDDLENFAFFFQLVQFADNQHSSRHTCEIIYSLSFLSCI